MRFAFVAKHRGIWAVREMCEALGVSRGGFYAWLSRPPTRRARENEELTRHIRRSFDESDRTYGSPRVLRDLRDWGIRCGKHRVARLMAAASEQAAYLSLLAGDAQVIEGVTSTAVIDQAKDESDLTVTQQPATAPYVIQLNTSVAPFNDGRAREAIYLATNVEAIRQGLFKGWYPTAESFTGPGGLFHAAQIPGYARHDAERARAIVEEIGPIEVKLGTLQSFVAEQVVTALQSQWRRAGIDVAIEMLDLGSLIQALRNREWQALLQTVGSYDPESGTGVTLRFGSGQLFSGVADPALDALFAEAAAATGMHDRETLYLAAARHISDNRYAPFLFAFSPTQIVARGVSGPGLTTPIPPIAINTAILWQDVRLDHR